MSGLKLWQEAVREYCDKNNKPYTIPKKQTQSYDEVKKIYEAKKNPKTEEVKPKESKQKCKTCKKCRCTCGYDKPK